MSFDRSLIVFKRIVGGTPIHNLDFSCVSFWVQIHNIPLSYMTTNVAISLGQSLGRVTIPLDESKLQGGDFMRVRDVVNIVEALCRGQRVTFNNDS